VSQQVVNLGRFVHNDVDSDLALTHLGADGDPYDFTGATLVKFVVQRIDGYGAAIEIAGSIYGSAVNGVLFFGEVARAVPAPRAREVVTYRGFTRWLNNGESNPSFSKTEWRFSVEKFPL